MGKLTKLFVLTILSIFMLSNVVLANQTKQATTDEQSIQISSRYTQNEINQVREIKNKVLKQGAVTLNTDGTITVNTDAATLGADENIFEKYIQSVENINDMVELGIASFDKNLELKVKSRDEITKIIYQRDKELRQLGTRSNNRFDTQNTINRFNTQNANRFNIQSMSISSTPQILAAYSIASTNKETIIDYYYTMLIFDPYSAYNSTVGYWVAKVKNNGDWDYKTVPGYAPYYTIWNAIQKDTISLKTSEWFGNYNYGFTGRELFSLSILLAGGDGVSLIFNHTIDDQQDKTDITQGYNESSGV